MTSILNDFFQLFLTVLSVLNPIGAVPIFLALTAGYSPEKLKSINTSCAFTVTVALIVSAYLGSYILNFFHISLDAFRIGGGILITLNALTMIQGKLAAAKLNDRELDKQPDTESVGIVPLAIPLLVGPGTISTVILYTKSLSTPVQWATSTVTFVLMGILVYFVMYFAKNIKRMLGEVGVNVMTRIMGLILIALGAEFIVTGIKGAFKL